MENFDSEQYRPLHVIILVWVIGNAMTLAAFIATSTTGDSFKAFLPLAIIGAVVTMIYFLPVWAACVRNSNHRWPIFAVNALLGWTIVGWVVAFIWAVAEKVEEPPRAKAIIDLTEVVRAPKSG
jgi:hypothetical protein